MGEPAAANQSTPLTGVIIAGLDRPELVAQLLAEHPPVPSGHSIPIYLVDPDASRARAVVDAGVIDPDASRIHLFTGNACVRDLGAFLSEHLESHLPRKIVASGAHNAHLARQIAPVLDALVHEQTTQTKDSRAALESRWAQRGEGYWGARYAQIRRGAPARVLVITTRYTTFVQHACGDLVDALVGQGHEAVLLREPDAHSTITPLLCTRAIESFDPDLIVVANYPRAMHTEIFPDGVPHVCWIQDAMAHLFQKPTTAPTGLDFIAGHLYDGALALEGYPDAARLGFPVPVSEAKFHDAPIPTELADRYACDIAYVSHQSQPANAYHDRFIERFPTEQHAGINAIRARIEGAIACWPDSIQDSAMLALKREMAAGFGKGDDAALQDMLWNQYIQPMAERLLRHETLGWAAQIARHHGLTLKLFGNGWERHPTLSRFASGVIPHDDHLRACYQSARVHLHASTLGSSHQRVFECAMSGGLVLSRRSWGEFHRRDWYRMSLFFNKHLPADASLVRWKHPAYVIDTHPELKSIIEDRLRMPRPNLGWDHEHFEHVYARVRTDPYFKYWDMPLPPAQLRGIETLGDPFETTFSTRAELEDKIMRAVNDPRWRQEHSSAIAGRARQRVSMSRFAQMLLGTVCDRLAPQPASSPDSSQAPALQGAVA